MATNVLKSKEDREVIAAMIAMDYMSGTIRNKEEIANKYGVSMGFVINSINKEIFKRLADQRNEKNDASFKPVETYSDGTPKYSDGDIGVKPNVPDLKVQEVQDADHKEEDTNNHVSSGKRLTEEEKISIICEYDSNLSVKEIADKFNVHFSTVYNTWKKEGYLPEDRPINNKKGGAKTMKKAGKKKTYNNKSLNTHQLQKELNKQQEEMKKQQAEKEAAVVIEKPKAVLPTQTVTTTPAVVKKKTIAEIEAEALSNRTIRAVNKPTCSVIKCGLIADRHDMPVSDFVFSRSLDSDLMFDFDRQYRMVEAFLRTRIKFEGGAADKEVICYVSGLQSPLVTLIRVCDVLHVKLTIMHFNMSTSTMWSAQQANNYPSPANKNVEKLETLFSRSRNVYSFGITDDQILSVVNQPIVYSVGVVTYAKRRRGEALKALYVDRYICKSYDDAFKLYPELLKRSRNSQDFISVVVQEMAFEKNGLSSNEVCRGNNRPEAYIN